MTSLEQLIDEPWARKNTRRERTRLGDVWVVSDVHAYHLAGWKRQLGSLAATSLARAQLLTRAHGSIPLASTRARMEAVAASSLELSREVLALFAEAGLEPEPGVVAQEGVPTLLGSWLQLVRDWSFGDETGENDAAVSDLRAVLPEGTDLGSSLVLGAGGGRVAYDLERIASVSRAVWLDLNPLSLLTAARILRGGTLRAYVHPHHPDDGTRAVGTYDLALPESAAQAAPVDRLLVLADARIPPFRPGSFDTVFTPFYIDQVAHDPWGTLRTIHAMLAPGGRWIHRGPLVYGKRLPWGRLPADELFEAIARCGFRVSARHEAVHPHCRDPLASDTRSLRVYTWVAERDDQPPEPLVDLSWLGDPRRPVPPLPSELDWLPATATLRAHVDGRRSAREIADRLGKGPERGAQLLALREAYFSTARTPSWANAG